MAAAPPEQLTLDAFDRFRQDIPADLLMTLDHREQLLICELLREPSLNRRIAAERVGYPKRSAKQRAHEVLKRPRVKEALDAAIRARMARTTVDADRVLREVDTVALSNVDFFRLDDEGYLVLAPHAPPDAMRAVRSFKRRVKTIPQDGGKPPIVEISSEFTLWGKPETLKLSMQHRGMLIEKHEVLLPPGSGVLRVPVVADEDAWARSAAGSQASLMQRPDAATPADAP